MKKIIKALTYMGLLLALPLTITSCGKDITKQDITGSLKLQRSAKDKKFMADGIQEVKLSACIDGDTTRFMGFGNTFRYLGIDTAESTASYEKWGKAASVFNKKLLTSAKSIIVEAEGSQGQTETNGRYLAYVWYQPADSDTYRNLNVELVENGYSLDCSGGNTKYSSYFAKAEKKAQKLKLGVNGNSEDIYYSENVQNVTIKELVTNPDKYFNKQTEVPACVGFDGYVTAVNKDSKSGYMTATVEYRDEADGRKYSYKLSVGYSGSAFYDEVKSGRLLHVVGWTTGEGEIHGLTYTMNKSMQTAEGSLYSYVKVTNYYRAYTLSDCTTTVKDGNATITGSTSVYDFSLGKNVSKLVTVVISENSLPNATSYTGSLDIKGYCINNDAYNLQCYSASEILKK